MQERSLNCVDDELVLAFEVDCQLGDGDGDGGYRVRKLVQAREVEEMVHGYNARGRGVGEKRS